MLVELASSEGITEVERARQPSRHHHAGVTTPLRPITGFSEDAEGHWVAHLACGHRQHVRHRPPWELRPWVVTEEGRREHLGVELPCIDCRDGSEEPPC
ncbi:MAG TPA: DUF3565 domain-containing protein [Polyangiaceae bacterium]|jgi:hypothetical protein|nr:DUF3565 domain-containing protein [Polyangiaceae bacterium]